MQSDFTHYDAVEAIDVIFHEWRKLWLIHFKTVVTLTEIISILERNNPKKYPS